jgi:hypothetical protein
MPLDKTELGHKPAMTGASADALDGSKGGPIADKPHRLFSLHANTRLWIGDRKET